MDWYRELESRGVVTDEVLEGILEEHGARGRRALAAVSEGRVKQYRDFVVVVGRSDEYVVEGLECGCEDQLYNLSDDEKCWHVVAVEVARAVDEVDHHDVWYSEVRDLMDRDA